MLSPRWGFVLLFYYSFRGTGGLMEYRFWWVGKDEGLVCFGFLTEWMVWRYLFLANRLPEYSKDDSCFKAVSALAKPCVPLISYSH